MPTGRSTERGRPAVAGTTRSLRPPPRPARPRQDGLAPAPPSVRTSAHPAGPRLTLLPLGSPCCPRLTAPRGVDPRRRPAPASPTRSFHSDADGSTAGTSGSIGDAPGSTDEGLSSTAGRSGSPHGPRRPGVGVARSVDPLRRHARRVGHLFFHPCTHGSNSSLGGSTPDVVPRPRRNEATGRMDPRAYVVRRVDPVGRHAERVSLRCFHPRTIGSSDTTGEPTERAGGSIGTVGGSTAGVGRGVGRPVGRTRWVVRTRQSPASGGSRGPVGGSGRAGQ